MLPAVIVYGFCSVLFPAEEFLKFTNEGYITGLISFVIFGYVTLVLYSLYRKILKETQQTVPVYTTEPQIAVRLE